jgi:L-iditol 2-dehydrogenase
MMLAAVKTRQKGEVVVKSVEQPRLSADEVLIRVDYCGVCGSDLHAYNHAPGYEFVQGPRILGHELSGEVVEGFGGAGRPLLHKRVTVESIQYCGECPTCRSGRTHICERLRVIGLHFDGGMAQYVKCDSRFVREVPGPLSNLAASLAEPMSIAVHAVEAIGKVGAGERVLVQGAGIIGFFTGIVCRSLGAEVIIAGLPKDRETRLVHAATFGMVPHVVGESGWIRDKADVVFECSGSPQGVLASLEMLKKGGRAVFVALYEASVELFLTRAVRNEWQLLTSYGCRPDDYTRAFGILQQYESQLQQMVSVYPLAQAGQAFADALQQKVLKPVLDARG